MLCGCQWLTRCRATWVCLGLLTTSSGLLTSTLARHGGAGVEHVFCCAVVIPELPGSLLPNNTASGVHLRFCLTWTERPPTWDAAAWQLQQEQQHQHTSIIEDW